MSGLDLAKNNLQLKKCNSLFKRLECSSAELAKLLHENFQGTDGIFVAWQIQSIIFGKFDGEKILLSDNLSPNFDDILEFRLFNRREELHLKRVGKIFIGRYVRDDEEAGVENFYVDSFARLWGESTDTADGWTTLLDAPRKISMKIPCDGGKKFYGLTTRNYICSDKTTGLSGYIDYRFVAIESAWDGD